MKLYYTPGACSLSPHIVLHELGLPHETERVDLKEKRTASGEDFTSVNPKGGVPALRLDGGEVLTEGPAIVQYLADLKPESGLAPAAGTLGRYRLQEMLNFITTELHKGFGPLFMPDTPDAYKETARATLTKRFAYVDGKLAGHSYLMGETFTVADAYLFVVMSWAGKLGVDLKPFANLGAFQERLMARPSVQHAMRHEGLTQ